MAELVIGFYKKSHRLANFALRIFLSFTVQSMSFDRKVQELLSEFRERGLQNLMRNPPASTPREETPPAPNQPMQTRSTRKKYKAEVRSKRNEERNKPSGNTPKNPMMNPSEEFEDFGEDENVAPHHPPYLSPI